MNMTDDREMSRRDYDKSRRQELKNFINAIKKNSRCEKCGTTDYRVLEFHHVNPVDKSFSIHKAVKMRYSIPKVMEELKKTIVLCSNCHRIEHYNDYDEEETQSSDIC